jgi:hypothetical protein
MYQGIDVMYWGIVAMYQDVVAAALMAKAAELLAQPPAIEKIDVSRPSSPDRPFATAPLPPSDGRGHSPLTEGGTRL